MRLDELLVADPPGAGFVGVEREYRVVRGGEAVDFRALLPHLQLRGGGLDPGDPNAHHLPSGILLTADGPEAEVATPPVPLAPGCSQVVSSWVEGGEDALAGALPRDAGIEGYSTHLNISVHGDVVEIAGLFKAHFALGMMLLLDRHDSPGLLVRPRAGRLELGGDFVAGEQLRAALTFAVAAARTCEDALGRRPRLALPAAAVAKVRTVTDRPGWFIPRDAFGADLYDAGRETLVRVGHAEIRAGDQLATAWMAARGGALGVADETELALVDDLVQGRRPIPLESLSSPDAHGDVAELDSPFARLHVRDRAGLTVTVAAMSWAAVAFEVVTAEASTHVVVPRRWLASFLRCADDGSIVRALGTSAPPSPQRAGPRLITSGFDARAVLPAEPRVRTSLWRHRRPEIIGGALGVAGAATAFAVRAWW